MLFDNSETTLEGQYAKYAEISIRREVARDGISTYYLNGTRCRRKDITGVFLGTGLGPRSYSIIEQGMISEVVEARPEEIRGHLEEAAGISKYKERRRDTENRIRRTRENLERLTDIREELERRLRSRGTDTAEVIARRLRDALSDMSHWHEFDYVIFNDDLDQAVADLEAVLADRGDESAADNPAVRETAIKLLD